MTRLEIEIRIRNSYLADPEYLWTRYPDFAVFRHPTNRKWFAVLMTIPKNKLGLESDEKIDVINLKCAQDVSEPVLQMPGLYPAYHMNKRHWITVVLDHNTSPETLRWLLEQSFQLTAPKIERRK